MVEIKENVAYNVEFQFYFLCIILKILKSWYFYLFDCNQNTNEPEERLKNIFKQSEMQPNDVLSQNRWTRWVSIATIQEFSITIKHSCYERWINRWFFFNCLKKCDAPFLVYVTLFKFKVDSCGFFSIKYSSCVSSSIEVGHLSRGVDECRFQSWCHTLKPICKSNRESCIPFRRVFQIQYSYL